MLRTIVSHESLAVHGILHGIAGIQQWPDSGTQQLRKLVAVALFQGTHQCLESSVGCVKSRLSAGRTTGNDDQDHEAGQRRGLPGPCAAD